MSYLFCRGTAFTLNELTFSMTEETEDLINNLSSSHLHYFHQEGYCAFNADTDFIMISEQDVHMGATSQRGAIDILEDICF